MPPPQGDHDQIVDGGCGNGGGGGQEPSLLQIGLVIFGLICLSLLSKKMYGKLAGLPACARKSHICLLF
jgi:hypothetical protein